jgi:hypothetical protein
MLRHRSAALRAVALRLVASQSTPPSDGAKAGCSPSSSSAATGREHLAAVRVDQELTNAEASAALHNPAQTNSTRKHYGKEGYNFLEHLRTSGPGAALARVRWTLSSYVLIGAGGLLYIVYYLTTYTYVLTTNPAPYRNSLFQHFPCDLAVVENRFTLKRHVVEVTPEVPPLLRDGAAEGDTIGRPGNTDDTRTKERGGVSSPARFVRPAPAIVERQLHVNALLHRVYLYLQKTHSLVLVNAQEELHPRRFMNRASSVGHDARAPVAYLREDQLMPARTGDTNAKPQSKKHNCLSWLWWRSTQAEKGHPAPSSSSADTSATTAGPTQVHIESEVRLRDAVNGYQKGHLCTYEQTMTHLVRAKLNQRFYSYILERGMAEHASLRRVYAEEMIRNGLISGEGVTLAQLVPDVRQFADELFDALKEKLGDDVIIYQYNVKLRE